MNVLDFCGSPSLPTVENTSISADGGGSERRWKEGRKEGSCEVLSLFIDLFPKCGSSPKLFL